MSDVALERAGIEIIEDSQEELEAKMLAALITDKLEAEQTRELRPGFKFGSREYAVFEDRHRQTPTRNALFVYNDGKWVAYSNPSRPEVMNDDIRMATHEDNLRLIEDAILEAHYSRNAESVPNSLFPLQPQIEVYVYQRLPEPVWSEEDAPRLDLDLAA